MGDTRCGKVGNAGLFLAGLSKYSTAPVAAIYELRGVAMAVDVETRELRRRGARSQVIYLYAAGWAERAYN